MSRFIQVADHMLGIENFERRSKFGDITSFKLLLFFNTYSDFAIKSISKFSQSHHFQVEDDLCHVFNNTLNRRKLMEHTWYFDSSDRITFQGRQQNSPQRIANGNSVSFFQRFECE